MNTDFTRCVALMYFDFLLIRYVSISHGNTIYLGFHNIWLKKSTFFVEQPTISLFGLSLIFIHDGSSNGLLPVCVWLSV